MLAMMPFSLAITSKISMPSASAASATMSKAACNCSAAAVVARSERPRPVQTKLTRRNSDSPDSLRLTTIRGRNARAAGEAETFSDRSVSAACSCTPSRTVAPRAMASESARGCTAMWGASSEAVVRSTTMSPGDPRCEIAAIVCSGSPISTKNRRPARPDRPCARCNNAFHPARRTNARQSRDSRCRSWMLNRPDRRAK